MNTNMLKTGMLLAMVTTLAGCGSMMEQNRSLRCSGSLYPYLNTNAEAQADCFTVPKMSLPLKVGVAFVPCDYFSGGVTRSSLPGEPLSADDKMSLLRPLGDQLTNYSFVKSVEIVPTSYLGTNGGFADLDRIQSTLGLDAMLLLASDQSQYSDEGAMAMSYWTIVGAYFVPGERDETKTVLDAGFVDIASQRLLFRATGASLVKGSATPVNLSEQLRRDSKRGFQQAVTNLSSGLKIELDQLGKRIKS